MVEKVLSIILGSSYDCVAPAQENQPQRKFCSNCILEREVVIIQLKYKNKGQVIIMQIKTISIIELGARRLYSETNFGVLESRWKYGS